MKLRTRFADAAPNHKGLVGAFTVQLARGVGLQQTSSAATPDLADLLQTATRLHANRLPRDHRPIVSQRVDSPASASCSGSGRSRKLASPKAARKVSVVTKV